MPITLNGGVIMIVRGLVPKMGALVESLPVAVLGSAGLVMFSMVAATGVRIFGAVDFRTNRFNGLVVAISLGMGMISLIALQFSMHLPRAIEPLIEARILLAAIAAVGLNVLFNGAKVISEEELVEAAKRSDGGH